MDEKVLKFRWTTFGFALFCFLMPFMTLSCPGGQYKFSGLDVAFGTTVEGQKLDGEPLVAIAIAAFVVALMASLAISREGLVTAAVSSAAGALCLLLAMAKITGDVQQQGRGAFSVSFGLGFWLALLAGVAGCVASILELQRAPPRAAEAGEDRGRLPRNLEGWD